MSPDPITTIFTVLSIVCISLATLTATGTCGFAAYTFATIYPTCRARIEKGIVAFISFSCALGAIFFVALYVYLFIW